MRLSGYIWSLFSETEFGADVIDDYETLTIERLTDEALAARRGPDGIDVDMNIAGRAALLGAFGGFRNDADESDEDPNEAGGADVGAGDDDDADYELPEEHDDDERADEDPSDRPWPGEYGEPPEDFASDPLSLREVAVATAVMSAVKSVAVTTSAEAAQLYERLLDSGVDIEASLDAPDDGVTRVGGPEGMEAWVALIRGVTMGLYLGHAEYFAPYLFFRRFHVFRQMCDEFEIPVPELPSKVDLRERALYYPKLNTALQEFRAEHSLTPGELCAFLYNFAPTHLAEEADGEMPSPSKVWFLMGGASGPSDFELLDDATESSRSFWQGNIDTRRGDICLMYCVKPRSALHSIWRSVTDGFADPFFYYFTTVWIGDPIHVPAVHFRDMAKHALLAQKPAVRAHFQGASGKPFTAEEYEAILSLLEEKGTDTSSFPRPQVLQLTTMADIASERDVEVRLLEPLFKSLGYTETDWDRTTSVRMGRGERVYPDYVLGVKGTRGEESGVLVAEAKLRISTGRELKEAYLQAKSYALRLQARVLVLAAVDGLWILRATTAGFVLDDAFHRDWAAISHPDGLHEVALLIGRRSHLWR